MSYHSRNAKLAALARKAKWWLISSSSRSKRASNLNVYLFIRIRDVLLHSTYGGYGLRSSTIEVIVFYLHYLETY